MTEARLKQEWERWWDARVSAMEAVFGTTDPIVGHATIPFDVGADLGGTADLVYFRRYVPGIVSVTSELIGRDDQILNCLGNYELAICHRDDESWGPCLISRLASYTLEAELNPEETMDVESAVPAGSSLSALLFFEFARFEVLGRRAGVLLCLGITSDEMALCRGGRHDEVEKALREKGIFPFTDLYRKSVCSKNK